MQALYHNVMAFLERHAPERIRCDHIAVDAVFAEERAKTLPHLPRRARHRSPPCWFPVYSEESLARGLMAVADRAFAELPESEKMRVADGYAPSPSSLEFIANLMVRYLSWCVPGPHLASSTELGRLLRKRRSLNPSIVARTAMQLWAQTVPDSWPDERKREQADKARRLVNRVFNERLRKQRTRAVDDARSDEVQEVVDEYKQRFVVGGVVVPNLLRWAAWMLHDGASAQRIGAEFAHELAPGRSLGDHRKRERLERVRAWIGERVRSAVEAARPADAVRLADIVCTALEIPLRDLCRPKRLRELMLPLGLELHAAPGAPDDADIDHFDAWVEVALGRQSHRTDSTCCPVS